MGKWRVHRLEEIAEIHNQKRVPLSKMQREKKRGLYPYYGASGIIDYIDEYALDGEFVLVSEDGENIRSRKTPVAFKASGQFWVNNHAHILKGKKKFHNDLLIQYFSNLDLNEYITGAVQPKLNKENLQSIPFFLPENEEEQKAISGVLSCLDDKIDLLHRHNKTLESLVETLFRQTFIEEAQDDWEVKSLLDLIDLIGGGTPKTSIDKYWFMGEIPWLSGGDIASSHKSILTKSDKLITQEGLENSSAKLLPRLSTVISARGTVGKYALLSQPMSYSQSNYGILPRVENCFFFTYLLINHAVSELQSAAYGSVFDTITTATFKDVTIKVPKDSKIKEFEQTVATYFNKKLNCVEQIQSLQNLRSILLPKLMSGEVRVQYDEAA